MKRKAYVNIKNPETHEVIEYYIDSIVNVRVFMNRVFITYIDKTTLRLEVKGFDINDNTDISIS